MVATNILGLVAPHDVATEGTLVGHLVDALVGVAANLHTLARAFERVVFLTFRATVVEGQQQANQHAKQQCRSTKQNESNEVAPVVAHASTQLFGYLSGVENLGECTHTLNHTTVEISLLEARNHHPLNYALTHRIGQVALDAIARLNLNGPLTEHQQHQQTIVLLLLAKSPMAEKGGGKLPRLVKPNGFHSHHSHLGSPTLAQAIKHRVYGIYGLGGEYSVGVAHKTSFVGYLHVGHGAHRVVHGPHIRKGHHQGYYY